MFPINLKHLLKNKTRKVFVGTLYVKTKSLADNLDPSKNFIISLVSVRSN